MRYVMAALALITCPCHLAVLLLALGGTAVGAALAEHTGLTALTMTGLFVVSAWGAVRAFSREGSGRAPAAPPRLSRSGRRP